MYLREIGQVDLLTADDERRLAQLIEEGHTARRSGSTRVSTDPAEQRHADARACSAASAPRAS